MFFKCHHCFAIYLEEHLKELEIVKNEKIFEEYRVNDNDVIICDYCGSGVCEIENGKFIPSDNYGWG